MARKDESKKDQIILQRDEQNSWKEQPTNRQMGSKRAWGISRAQKP